MVLTSDNIERAVNKEIFTCSKYVVRDVHTRETNTVHERICSSATRHINTEREGVCSDGYDDTFSSILV